MIDQHSTRTCTVSGDERAIGVASPINALGVLGVLSVLSVRNAVLNANLIHGESGGGQVEAGFDQFDLSAMRELLLYSVACSYPLHHLVVFQLPIFEAVLQGSAQALSH